MKHTVAWLLAIVAWAFQPAWAGEVGVPVALDLKKDAALAKDKQGVVLVVFTGARCSYCETVLNEFLIPMSRNAEYQGKVVMRRVVMSGLGDMKDFQGRKITQREFAGDNGIYLVPTVVVFNSAGEVLAKPVVGLSTVDYYGHYLDQAIDQGVNKVRGIHAAVTAPRIP